MPLITTRTASPEQRDISVLARLTNRTQLDFELDFYGDILRRSPDYVDVLRAQSANLTVKGNLGDGLNVDQSLARLLPDDPEIRYNLACRYALLKNDDLALEELDRAVTLGYRDFAFMMQDRDLDALRKDPRFKKWMRSRIDR